MLMGQTVTAQTANPGGWYVLNFNYHLTKSLALYSQVETRSQKVTNNFYHDEIQAGLAYQFPKHHSALLGFGEYENYTNPGNFKKPLSSKEYRIWEQFVINSNFGRVKIDHRYRIEQRWINNSYRNGFRYRCNVIVPINHQTITPHTLFGSASEEVFFSDKLPNFQRNRVFGGFGFQFSKLFTLQAGFIHQYDFKLSNTGFASNYIQTSFLFNAGHPNPRRERHPSTMD